MKTRIESDRAIHYCEKYNQSIVIYNPWEEGGKWNFSYTVGDGNYIEENEMVMVDGGIEEFDVEQDEIHKQWIESAKNTGLGKLVSRTAGHIYFDNYEGEALEPTLADMPGEEVWVLEE